MLKHQDEHGIAAKSLSELKDLYPHLGPEELVVARENLDRYLTLAWEIFEDAHMAGVIDADFQELVSGCTMKERSIPSKT